MRTIAAVFSKLLIPFLLLQAALLAFSPARVLGLDCISPAPTVCGSTFANGFAFGGGAMSTAAVPPFPIEFQHVGNTAAIVGSGLGGISASSMANANYGWLQAFSIADNGTFTTQVISFVGRARTSTGGDASFRDKITVNSGVLSAGQPVQMKVVFSGSGAYPPGTMSGGGTLQYSVFSLTRNFFLLLTPNAVISLNSQFPTWVAQHTLDVLVGEELVITMNIQAFAHTDNEFPLLVIAGAADTSARAFLDSLNPDVTLDAASGHDYRTNASGPVTLQVVCPVAKLQSMVDDAQAGTTLSVFGNCNENVIVRNEKQRITIDGNSNATIAGLNANAPTVNVRGKGILIQNFAGISGGSHGIHVNRGSNAVLNNNVIQNTNGNGVLIDELAFAVLTNNTIQNHPGAGVFVSEASTGRIGFNSEAETTASPNTVQNNALGVVVSNGSSARVIGNTIQNNTGAGVQVSRDSQADIASNAINGNGDGIAVEEQSQVQLGEDTGTNIFGSPNTTTSPNTGFGLKCTNGGMADGRQSSLSGSSGLTSFDGSCLNSLIP
jgi:hypothetical protein